MKSLLILITEGEVKVSASPKKRESGGR